MSRSRDFVIPRQFRPDRDKPAGRFPLLEVFRGFTETPPFRKYPGDDKSLRKLVATCWAHVSDGPGWMYVAPRKTPPEVRRAGFKMVESRDDEIVVSRSYLSGGPPMYVYLDLVHEFLHIVQRNQGRQLWPGLRVPYVDRHTEIEAYAFSIAEARRLGVPDTYLRRYLKVPWITRIDYFRLLRNVGVSLPSKGKKGPSRA